jgi:hypothetical protein
MIAIRVASGAYGNSIEASVVLAPTKSWKAQAKTLGTIVKNIAQLQAGCLTSS